MPTYDGLELIQMTRKLFPEIAFIVISGYSQFEYAQTALRYGVVNYLLKPIKKKELEDTIIKIMEHHISKRNIENRQREIELNLKNITKNNREMLLYNLLFSSNGTLRTKTMNEINLNYSCCFREGDFVVIIIKMFSVQSENSCRRQIYMEHFPGQQEQSYVSGSNGYGDLCGGCSMDHACKIETPKYLSKTTRKSVFGRYFDWKRFGMIFLKLYTLTLKMESGYENGRSK